MNSTYDYAEHNSQAHANQSSTGRSSTLVLKIACANIPHTGARSNHPAIFTLVALSTYQPCRHTGPCLSPQAPNRIQSP